MNRRPKAAIAAAGPNRRLAVNIDGVTSMLEAWIRFNVKITHAYAGTPAFTLFHLTSLALTMRANAAILTLPNPC
jgi:hypothetical protein